MVIDKIKEKRLKDNKINIKTTYRDGFKLLERNTDNSHNDDIKEGFILEKDYYKDGSLVNKETVFDHSVSFAFTFHGNERYVCKNCGKEGVLSDFATGCPKCHASYNMDYQFKDNSQEEFWHSMNFNIDEKIKFFNDVNYALSEYFYSEENENIIDFDIINYKSFEKIWKEPDLYVIINMDIRIVSLNDDTIVSKTETKKFRFKKYSINQKHSKTNNKYQEWFLD